MGLSYDEMNEVLAVTNSYNYEGSLKGLNKRQLKEIVRRLIADVTNYEDEANACLKTRSELEDSLRVAQEDNARQEHIIDTLIKRVVMSIDEENDAPGKKEIGCRCGQCDSCSEDDSDDDNEAKLDEMVQALGNIMMELGTLDEDGELRLSNTKLRKHYAKELEDSIKKISFYENPGVTVVKWADGTSTKVTVQPGDTFTKENGLVECLVKKSLGNEAFFSDILRDAVKKFDVPAEKKLTIDDKPVQEAKSVTGRDKNGRFCKKQ